MASWFPCCCDGRECFRPCDCFDKGCELHLTVSGWTDNGATNCSGIADNVFNRTHVITSANITGGAGSSQCEFTIAYEDLVLTKGIDGNCSCETQPTEYTIVGTLSCVEKADGTGYGLRVTLRFNVPTYDLFAGCAPPPCTVEPVFEQWIFDYSDTGGRSTGSQPICVISPGPYVPTTTPTAVLSCGYGLDGTDSEVLIEWKFCDPVDGCCSECCSETSGSVPDLVSVTINGLTDVGPLDPLYCPSCSFWDGTYILERNSAYCTWAYREEFTWCGETAELRIDLFACGSDRPATSGHVSCWWNLYVTFVIPGGGWVAIYSDQGSGYASSETCSSWSSRSLDPWRSPLTYWTCEHRTSTATITAL